MHRFTVLPIDAYLLQKAIEEEAIENAWIA